MNRAGFDRAVTREIAQAVGEINAKLVDAGRPYLLVGMGRWGTLDPWLGIPVKWDQISGARAIVEANFTDTAVEPSQGSHFFQNITSFQVGYLTVGVNDLLDWEWLMALPLTETRGLVRHAAEGRAERDRGMDVHRGGGDPRRQQVVLELLVDDQEAERLIKAIKLYYKYVMEKIYNKPTGLDN